MSDDADEGAHQGLRGVLSEFGASSLAQAIENEYDEQLMPQYGPAGMPFDELREVGQSVRTHDHGQASSKTVTEVGVKASFDPDETSITDLTEGGSIRQHLRRLAEQHFTCDLQDIDVMDTGQSFDVWLIADRETL